MNIAKMNEATVRAEKLDPLLQMLGYRFGTDMNVLREHQFAYPNIQFGRKSKNDPKLVGRPDYICYARGIATWVLEAKAQGEKLDEEVSSQAYTYAAHPEIRAVYYALSDGLVFELYRTLAPVNSEPAVSINLSDLELAADSLRAFLSAEALRKVVLRDRLKVDGEGNGETIITHGSAHFDNVRYEIVAPDLIRNTVDAEIKNQISELQGTIYPIEKGKLFSSGGELHLLVDLGGHSQRDLEFQALLGIDVLKFVTLGDEVSQDPTRPTIFQTTQNAVLSPGDLIQSSRVAPRSLPIPLKFEISVDAYVHKVDDKIIGHFRYTSYSKIIELGPVIEIQVAVEGRLDIKLK